MRVERLGASDGTVGGLDSGATSSASEAEHEGGSD
jgi:hypothetical protein